MGTEAVRFMTVEGRPTAVVAQATTWAEFTKLLGVPAGVRSTSLFAPRPATGCVMSCGRAMMLYKDQRPDVEVGVLVSGPFEAEGPAIQSALPARHAVTATHRGDYAELEARLAAALSGSSAA